MHGAKVCGGRSINVGRELRISEGEEPAYHSLSCSSGKPLNVFDLLCEGSFMMTCWS